MAKLPNNQSASNTIENIKNSEKLSKGTGWPANALWIIFLLVLVLMLLTTWILKSFVVSGDGLLSALENFSTILSIVLSISSIAFAGYTSVETSRQFHYMSRAVEEIRTSNRIMSDNYKNLLDHYHDTVNSFSKILTQQEDGLKNNKISTIPTNNISNVRGNGTTTAGG